MAQAQALYALQEIDLKIIAQNKRLETLTQQLQDNQSVLEAQQQVEAAQKRLTPLHTKQKDLELEIQTNRQKAKASEDRLYSGNVKNPKEMQDLQQEIASLKQRNQTLEDQLLDLMLTIEAAEADLQTAERHLAAVTAQWQAEHTDLLSEKAAIETELEQLAAQREKAVTQISAQNRKIYDTMKKKKANRPVSLMQGRMCTACGVEQTMAIEQAVSHNADLVYCENCGRILVK
ncbi:MAG: hypothetical protein CUN56_03140 [Phototrophicales bacterium]|nr:MAG: hypothetical protein CUN56_03140 [Phototrophicales bacterium]RMG76060.1 MAG: hypothetical protein D6711_04875 [Chloroflexota bacterium]